MKRSVLFFLFLCMLSVQDLQAQGSRIFWVAEGPMASDFDGDGEVGFKDFVLFSHTFNTRSGEPGFNARMDLNGDGTIDFQDFISFSAAYGNREPDEPEQMGYAVYVADFPDNSVGVFDFDTHLLIDYLPFRGPGSIRVSQDQKSIYVSEVFGLFALDTKHEAVFTVPTNSQGRIELSRDGKLAYVTEERTDRLRIVDLVARATVDTIAVGERPVGLDLAPDGKKLYVINTDSRDVSVVDLERREVVGRIVIGARPAEVGVTADGLRAYVANLDRGVISVLDLVSDRVVGAIQLDGSGAQGLTFSPDGKTLYVVSDGLLLAIDVKRNLISKRLRVGDATSTVGVSPDGSRAYVGTLLQQEGGPGLTAVDLVNWRILGRMRGFDFPVEIQFRRVSARGEAQ